VDQNLLRKSAAEVWRAREETQKEEIVHISSIVQTKLGVGMQGATTNVIVTLMDG